MAVLYETTTGILWREMKRRRRTQKNLLINTNTISGKNRFNSRSSFIIFNSNLEKKEIVDQQSDCMPGHFDNCLGELRAKQSAALALRTVGKSTGNFDISREEVLFQRGFCSLCNQENCLKTS